MYFLNWSNRTKTGQTQKPALLTDSGDNNVLLCKNERTPLTKPSPVTAFEQQAGIPKSFTVGRNYHNCYATYANTAQYSSKDNNTRNTRIDGTTIKVNNDDSILSSTRRKKSRFDDGTDVDNNNNDNDNCGDNKNKAKNEGYGKAAAPVASQSLPVSKWGQTVVFLVTRHAGCGILSLPWAISQLGIPLGLLGILFVLVWTSYNRRTVTELRKQCTEQRRVLALSDGKNEVETKDLEENDKACNDDEDGKDDDDDETSSRRSGSMAGTSITSVVSNDATAASATTYPDAGDEWAYCAKLHSYLSVCVCCRHLAICTVLVGFVGENLRAALRFRNPEMANNHTGRGSITALCLPIFLVLSCSLPTVKSMLPLVATGTILMLAGVGLVGWIGLLKWDERPEFDFDELPQTFQRLDGTAFVTLCGILYSFEGIFVVPPVNNNSPMNHNNYSVLESRSAAVSLSTMVMTLLLCGMAGLSILVFGEVTNGSITAFLLETYGGLGDDNDTEDQGIASKAFLANLLVSLSIVLVYPLVLYPVVEQIAPAIFDLTRNNRRKAKETTWSDGQDDEDSLGFTAKDENYLEGFEPPMGGIPENDGKPSTLRSVASFQDRGANADASNHGDTFVEKNNDNLKTSPLSSSSTSIDAETFKTEEATDGGGMSESASLLSSRLGNGSNTSYQRSIVESVGSSDCEKEDESSENSKPRPEISHRLRRRRRRRKVDDSAFEWVLPGDSPMVRAALVLSTFLVALLVPNVHLLVCLVGAVVGSLTTLLIPPILKLAYIRHAEAKEATERLGTALLGEWEGGPSIASKRMLLLGNHSPEMMINRDRYSPEGSGRSSSPRHGKENKNNKYLWDKILSWLLLILGSVFAFVGSYFSIQNILQSYM